METIEGRTDYEQARDKPLPSLNHGPLQFLIAGALHSYRDQYTIASERTLQLDNLRFTPDLCVYPKMHLNFQENKVRMTEPPLLTVEIESPTQSPQDVVVRISGMLEKGVESCWLVPPATETSTIFTEGEKPITVSSGTLQDPATDIKVDVSDLFAEE